MLNAALLSKSIMNCKHAYSDSFLRKVLVHNKVIVSIGVSLNAIRPSYFAAASGALIRLRRAPAERM